MMAQESGRLIKANAAQHIGSKVTFNYDDLRQKCDEHISAAREEGRRLIAEARAQADAVRERAYQDGHSAGQREGLEAARDLIESRAEQIAGQKTQERLRTALPAIDAAVIELNRVRDRWLADV